MRYKRVQEWDERAWSHTTWDGGEGWDVGAVRGPDGIVLVTRYFGRARPNAWMEHIVNGRLHTAYITPCPTRRGLIRMARRWLRELMAEVAKE
jgi:hypothetical protein